MSKDMDERFDEKYWYLDKEPDAVHDDSCKCHSNRRRDIKSFLRKELADQKVRAIEIANDVIQKRITTAWHGSTAIGKPWSHLTVEGELEIVEKSIATALKEKL